MKYIKASEIHDAIINYGKGAISVGKKTLDPVDDIVALARLVYFLPCVELEADDGKI